MNYRERLKTLREDHDLTQSDIAEITNTNQRTISQYESGKRQIPIEIIILLAEYYNVSTDYILCMSERKEQKNQKTVSDRGSTGRIEQSLEKIKKQVKLIESELSRQKKD